MEKDVVDFIKESGNFKKEGMRICEKYPYKYMQGSNSTSPENLSKKKIAEHSYVMKLLIDNAHRNQRELTPREQQSAEIDESDNEQEQHNNLTQTSH